MKDSVVILGAGGMLGGEVRRAFSEAGFTCLLGSSREDADMLHLDILAEDIGEKLAALAPKLIVNCAAYTAVDQAEADYQQAFALNFLAVERLARFAAESNCFLVHVSTDYVFGSEAKADVPYVENAPVSPCGVYGLSKYAGELAVRELLPENSLVVRTSWLHSPGRNNFLETMLKLAQDRDSLRIVDDQVGSPTYVPALADSILALVKAEARGVFHVCGDAAISWLEFAEEIFKQAGVSIELSGQSTEECARPAPRPAYSALSPKKLEEHTGIRLDWREGISKHLALR